MCESSVYIRENDKDTLLVEDVARVVPDGDELRVLTLLGEETRVKGDLIELDLMSHKIVIAKR